MSLQTLALPPRQISIPASSSYPCPTPKHATTRRSLPNSVIPTGAAAQFAAVQWRDHGNQSTHSLFGPPNPSLLFPLPPIHFSYPSHSFFLLCKCLFPFDAAFPLALPLDC